MKRPTYFLGRAAGSLRMLAMACLLAPGLSLTATNQATAQTAPAAGAPGAAAPGLRRVPEATAVQSLNAWTVGLVGGQLEGAPIRFATEIARVVDDGDNLHVLPIVTRGPMENVEALLYLKGVDAAIINSDALEQFKTQVPNIQQRVRYILNLFPSELHVFVRPEIKSLDDLKGKKVNFNTVGTSAAFTGPIIFDRLKLDVTKTFIPHQVALEQMKAGNDDMAAVVFVTSKPVDAFLTGKWQPGFKFVNVPFEDFGFYLPSELTHADYPQLIADGDTIKTIAVPTILAAYNWPANSDHYKRVTRLTNYLFNRLDRLQQAGFHPKWKDVNPDAKVPGLERFPAAQEWLDRAAAARSRPATPVAATSGQQQVDVAPLLKPEDARLYQEFLEWRRQHGQ